MHKRIVYTRHDGGVSICCPSGWAIAMMSCGGMWRDMPRGFCDQQVERQIARGVTQDVAWRFVNAMQFGGCTTAEALEIIRDRDCAHRGTAIELWNIEDVPPDRWFRDAWRRSHNGGPVSVDLKSAKPIQFAKIAHAVNAENKRRAQDLERFDQKLDLDFHKIKASILASRDEVELRHVWPKELTQ